MRKDIIMLDSLLITGFVVLATIWYLNLSAYTDVLKLLDK